MKIYSQESTEMTQKLSSLISANNGWESMKDFFYSNDLAARYYDEVMEEMRRDGNVGMACCMVEALNRAFYDLKTYIEDDGSVQ